MEPRPCGTDAAYRRHLRRGEEPCAACQAAHYRMKKRVERARLECGLLSHGECRTYNAGCRCDDCRRANSEYHRDYRARRAHNLSLLAAMEARP